VSRPAVTLAVVLVEGDGALVELGGISLLERLLRTLQRAGIRDVAVLAHDQDVLTRHLACPSPARAGLAVAVRSRAAAIALFPGGAVAGAPVLLLPAETVYDPRLLVALLQRSPPTALVDSAPPLAARTTLLDAVPRYTGGFICGPLLADGAWVAQDRVLADAVRTGLESGDAAALDVASLDTYSVTLRRRLRPYWFPAPKAPERRAAEAVLLDAAQKGTPDLPAWVHGPIENLLVRRLWRTPVTPNQVTLFTTLVAWLATLCFATGRLGAGVGIALLVGILDGVDGKLARAKVATSELGEWEHYLDWMYEFSWWFALAWHLHRSGDLPAAFPLFGLLLVADLLERGVRRAVKRSVGRDLDTVDTAGRLFRVIGGRRNVYVWCLAAALLLERPAQGYVLLCVWGAVSAAFHLAHGIWIFARRRPSLSAGG
jgi:phosphatidylglycerophosphate synthase